MGEYKNRRSGAQRSKTRHWSAATLKQLCTISKCTTFGSQEGFNNVWIERGTLEHRKTRGSRTE